MLRLLQVFFVTFCLWGTPVQAWTKIDITYYGILKKYQCSYLQNNCGGYPLIPGTLSPSDGPQSEGPFYFTATFTSYLPYNSFASGWSVGNSLTSNGAVSSAVQFGKQEASASLLTANFTPPSEGSFWLNGSGYFSTPPLGYNSLNWMFGTTDSAFVTIAQFPTTQSINNNASYSLSIGGLVPEPSTWLMMMAGFGAVGAALRRSRVQLRSLAA